MKEAIVARAYAQSIYALGKEKNVDVTDELTKLTEAINSSNDLENLMYLDVFTEEEKISVTTVILEKLGLSGLSKNIIFYLFSEKRMALFPLIFKDLVVMDDNAKGFLRGTIEGAGKDLPEEFKQKILSYVEKKLDKKVELNYTQTNNITAGYRVTVEDLQLDASIDNQLNQLKSNILNG